MACRRCEGHVAVAAKPSQPIERGLPGLLAKVITADRFGTRLEEQACFVLPKSPLGVAIGYARSNWAALNRYFEAEFLSIDNNASERAVKPVAIGRRIWLFAGSEGGGRTAAILFSFASTCKALGIDAFAYLRNVLDRVCTHPARRIAKLLPDRLRAARSGSALVEAD